MLPQYTRIYSNENLKPVSIFKFLFQCKKIYLNFASKYRGLYQYKIMAIKCLCLRADLIIYPYLSNFLYYCILSVVIFHLDIGLLPSLRPLPFQTKTFIFIVTLKWYKHWAAAYPILLRVQSLLIYQYPQNIRSINIPKILFIMFQLDYSYLQLGVTFS